MKYGHVHQTLNNEVYGMLHVKRIKKIVKGNNYAMTTEEVYIDESGSDEFLGLKYNSFRFDKESMEYMAKEATRVFESYEMEQELEALEEENFYALSEKYRLYTTLELIKKLFK